MIVFVYGTLRRGHQNHRLIADQKFLGEAVTMPRYKLYQFRSYPGLVEASPSEADDEPCGEAIRGELYEVNEYGLAELDNFEGVPYLFVRKPILLQGEPSKAEAYFYNRPVGPN